MMGNMMMKAQEYSDKTEEVFHLLNVTPGEKLTKAELQKRLKLGRYYNTCIGGFISI